MRVFLLSLSAAFLSTFTLQAQQAKATKPTLMVMPSDTWCYNTGVLTQEEYDGVLSQSCDYQKAFLNSDLNNVLSKIGILMSDRGFPLEDFASSYKKLQSDQILYNNSQSKSNNSVNISIKDQVLNSVKSDILLEIDWQINNVGPRKSVTYNLRAIDSYTSKQVAGAQGTGAPSFNAEIPVLLEEAVLTNMDNFAAQLQNHFDDLFENGRAITVNIRVFENDEDIDLESEFDGEELQYIIEDWMSLNTVKSAFNLSTSTENYANYTNVRIPMFKTTGQPMVARDLGRELSKYLKTTYAISSKVDVKGIGEIDLYIANQ